MLTRNSAHGEQRDQDQQVEGGQLGVDVGVAGAAVDRAPGREHQLEALEVVAGRLQQGQHRQQHRQMGLDLRRHLLQRRLEPDAAVEVVGDGGDDQDDDQRREEPVDDELGERQLEDVEADVAVELRVPAQEGDLVAEQQPRLPLPGDTRRRR